MEHYFPKDREDELKVIAEANAFTGPCFVGQGLSRSVGSDCYGHYVVSIGKAKNGKPLIGICRANSHMLGSWEEGTEVCEMPADPVADEWITTFGKTKSGKPKWYYCDACGKRYNGHHASFGWNGAHGYRDPSF